MTVGNFAVFVFFNTASQANSRNGVIMIAALKKWYSPVIGCDAATADLAIRQFPNPSKHDFFQNTFSLNAATCETTLDRHQQPASLAAYHYYQDFWQRFPS